MATLLEDLAQTYLPTTGLSLTFGTNLFGGIMPTNPDACTAVFEYSGGAPQFVMGSSNPSPAISMPNVQVLVRVNEDSYLTGRALIANVAKKLELITNTSVNSTLYFRVQRRQDPFMLHRDPSRRVYFCCNFDVEKVTE